MIATATKLVLHTLRVLWALSAPVDPDDVEGLRAFAPTHLTTEQAEEHFYAARVASAVHGQDVWMVLGVSEHESNFQQGAITYEVGGKISCGVMTAVPTYSKEECERQTSSLLAGYLAGAEHLYTWYHAGGVYSQIEALRGVGGGYRLIRACRLGPVLRYSDHGDDLCNIGATFNWMRSRLVDSVKLAHRRPSS